MHLYARYFNDTSPTPRGRRSPQRQPALNSPAKIAGKAQRSPRHQSPTLQTSPGRPSFKLLSLVSRFEALDALSLPPTNTSPMRSPLYLHENSPIHDFAKGFPPRKKLATIFRTPTYEQGTHDGFVESEQEDIFTSPSTKAVGRASSVRIKTANISTTYSINKSNSLSIREYTRDPSYNLRVKERMAISGPRVLPETPSRKRANSIRDMISFFDGAASRSNNTQTVSTPTELNTPRFLITGDAFSLSGLKNRIGIKQFSSRDEMPSTPIKSQTSICKSQTISVKKRPWILGSGTPTRFLSRASQSKSPNGSISPYTTNKTKSRGSKFGSLFARTPTGSNIIENTETPSERFQGLAVSEDRGRKRVTTKVEEDDEATSSRKQLSNKIAELYRAKSMERKRAEDEENPTLQQARTAPTLRPEATSSSIKTESIHLKSNLFPRTTHSRVSDIKRIFESGLNKTKSPPAVLRDILKREFIAVPKPVFRNSSPFIEERLLVVERPLSPSPPPTHPSTPPPPPPPTPPPLPELGHSRPLKIPPKTLSEPSKPSSASTLHTVIKDKQNSGPEDESSPYSGPQFKKQAQLRSKGIQDKIRQFEEIKDSYQQSDVDKRRDSLSKKVRKSLQGLFEPGSSHKNSGEGTNDKGKGINTKEMERIVNEVQAAAVSVFQSGNFKDRTSGSDSSSVRTPSPQSPPRRNLGSLHKLSPTGGHRSKSPRKRSPLGEPEAYFMDLAKPEAQEQILPQINSFQKRGKRGTKVGRWNHVNNPPLTSPTKELGSESSAPRTPSPLEVQASVNNPQKVLHRSPSVDRRSQMIEEHQSLRSDAIEGEAIAAGPKACRKGKGTTHVGRWNTFPDLQSSNGGDGTSSLRVDTSSANESSTMVVKEVECTLKHPKPLRVVEMKRMMLICRERIGNIRDKERSRGSGSVSKKL